MSLFDFFTKPAKSAPRSGEPEWDGLQFAIDDPRIPESIRVTIMQDFRPGYILFFADTDLGGEWWLLDDDQLVEAYSLA